MTDRWDAEAPRGRDERIVWEAKKRLKRCDEWESEANANGDDDEKFGNGDSINMWQWPQSVLSVRQPANGSQQPCLTINKTRQHCLQVINDARQNKSSVKIIAVSDGATAGAAQVWMGIVRHIENLSNATAAYDKATWDQVFRGIGYWRITTDYAHDGTLNQEIFIRRVPSVKNVRLDPDIQEADGSDARFGFIFEDVAREAFEADYPKVKLEGPGIDSGDEWVRKDTVRVAEYFRRVTNTDRLLALPDGSTVLRSQLDAEPDGIVREREVSQVRMEWFKIAGTEIVDRKAWPGKYVPIVRQVGEETVIDGKLDRKGHVRALRDPQRMYNYWTSAATTNVALQNGAPYLGPAAAIEGFETIWATANTANVGYLPFNHIDDQNAPIPAPIRQQPPVMADAFLKGLQVTANEMMMASGQYQAEMGAPSNERSGVAIERRQRQADNATYHFVERQAQAIRYTGKILLDLIPKVYDVERVQRILNEDGTEDHVKIDPNAPAAHQEMEGDGDADARIIFNPNIGQYSVEADIGPAFATARQEAFQAFTQIVSANKEMGLVLGDLWMKNADIPGAEEAAKRLRAMVPPQALGDDPALQAVQQQAQQALQQAQAIIQNLTQQVAAAKLDRRREDEGVVVDAYKAETERLKAVQPALTPDALRPIVMQLMTEMFQAAPLGQSTVAGMGGGNMQAGAAALAQAPAPMPTNGGGNAPA